MCPTQERKSTMANFKQYTKKDGTTLWQFQAYLGTDPMTGKSVKTTRRNFRSKKEAQTALARLQIEFDESGLSVEQEETFQEVYELWLEGYKTTVRKSTLSNTIRRFEKWILPVYGHLKVNKITIKKAQKIVNSWSKECNFFALLHSNTKRVFKYAMHIGLLTSNPLEYVMVPKKKSCQEKKAIKVYTKEEMRQFLACLNNQSATYGHDFNKTLIRFLFYSGCRAGEALALDWSDIDFKNNTVSINKTLSMVKGGVIIEEPKTQSSIATITMDKTTMRTLKKWQVNQRQYMLLIGVSNPNMVFCSREKKIVRVSSFYVRFRVQAEKAGVPFYGVHATRHTHASVLINSGASMKEVQERLRHSSIVMTMDIYSHLFEETKEKTVDKFVDYIEN